jgi:hypothetical protein
MPEYRAYVVGLDGHFTDFEGMICEDDAKAIEKARRLVDGHDVELWNGARLVIRLNAAGKQGTVSHDVVDGRMIRKT